MSRWVDGGSVASLIQRVSTIGPEGWSLLARWSHDHTVVEWIKEHRDAEISAGREDSIPSAS